MREMQLMVDDVLEDQLEALWRRHGPWAIVKGLIGTSLRRSQPWAKNRIGDLTNYMRRDIGLKEVVDDNEERALQLRRFL
ncbi:hypothetical protein J2T09_002724 [Neorhizobium huautlense]|uniref:DUF1127 domain-containing protein n=1 Tax=Neorhizobium huautlense TaxID=67774 RepID=A0ABT9PVS9_9HYPH|nr:hypothetical protein [Neorhizobium huautlense]MDP9837964.1 hypothetical protein [Neorhizobium huautlense]